MTRPTGIKSNSVALYRTIWRWHFYAGLFVLPFVLILAVSGSLYLFKPQIEQWEERGFNEGSSATTAVPHVQVEAALEGRSRAEFLDYRLPRSATEAAMVRLSMPDGSVRQVFVAPNGAVRGELVETDRWMALVKRIHSELLVGTVGNRLVELAASWTIVMLLTGLYLWWPRGRGLGGVVWPRLGRAGRPMWRDLHAVTGFWISSLALVLLFTGLPWTGVWGEAFNTIRTEMGWVTGPAQWNIGSRVETSVDQHAAHDHGGTMAGPAMPTPGEALNGVIARAVQEGLAFPTVVTPPQAPGPFGAPGVDAWTVRSDSQVPGERVTIRYSLDGRQEVSRESFYDSHPIDRIVGYGIAWHEGQLFGWLNQLIGVLTALGLILLTVSGFIMWRRRKPAAHLGAPPAGPKGALGRGLLAAAVALALFLPMLAMSVAVLWLFDRIVVRRVPALARWLGMEPQERQARSPS